MKTFSMHIHSSVMASERFDDLVSFIGRDSSGSFGLMANAERKIAVLTFGLASYRRRGGERQYLALPGGLVYFKDNELLIATRRWVRHADFKQISRALESEIQTSEEATRETRHSLRRLDEEILKRLSRVSWKIEQ